MIETLKDAIERTHGGTATLAQSVPVHETWQGQTVWEGTVHVFDLAGHPIATRAYAWPFPAGARLLFLVVAALVVRNVGRRIHWRPATAYLVGSLGVLLALVAQW